MGTKGRTVAEGSMIIQLDKYIFTMKCWSDLTQKFGKEPSIVNGIDKNNESGLKVFWGSMNEPTGHSVVLETGFFNMASHLDTVGLYRHSSLCTPQALREIEKFESPAKIDVVSKYPQGQDPEWRNKEIDWHGVVLACQNPYDRSIRSVASPEDYHKFIENACKFYGKDLFIKLHPWNSGEHGERLRAIATKYGVTAAKINHRIIEKCKFVLVFNSTFIVDCMVRDIPVAEYAPGYFWQNPAVQYTNGTFPTEIKTDVSFGQKTCEFLMWKYCFNHSMPFEDWMKMFNIFAKSRELFPMPKELSYAGYKM